MTRFEMKRTLTPFTPSSFDMDTRYIPCEQKRSNIGNRNIIGLHRQAGISYIYLLIGVDRLQAMRSQAAL
jgi:hypothetical protein